MTNGCFMEHLTVNDFCSFYKCVMSSYINCINDTGRSGESMRTEGTGVLGGCNVRKGGRRTQKEKAGS